MTPSFPGLSDRLSGTIQVFPGTLVFRFLEPGRPEIRFATSRLDVKVEGHNNIFYVLTDRGVPGVSVSTTSTDLLRALADGGVTSAQAALGRAGTRDRSRKIPLALFIAIPVLLVLAVPFAMTYLPADWLNRLVSIEQEIRWRKKFVDEEPKPSEATILVRQLAEPLLKASPGLAAYEVDISVSSSKDVNAYAIPGGLVVVTTGLIQQAESLEEIQGVLGHELGHIEKRHSLKALVSSLGVSAGLVTISLMFGADLSLWIARGQNLVDLKFSRDHELEADAHGTDLMLRAGIPPEKYLPFLQRMKRQEPEGRLGQVLKFTSTHPLSEDRLRILEKMLQGQVPSGVAEKPPFMLEKLKAAVAAP